MNPLLCKYSRMNILRVFALVTVIVANICAFSHASSATDVARQDCSSLSGVTDIVKCNESRIKDAERNMTNLIEELNHLLPSESEIGSPRTALSNEQAAWLRYRKARCDFIATIDPEGGRWRSVAFIQCVYEMTTSRVSELEQRKTKLK